MNKFATQGTSMNDIAVELSGYRVNVRAGAIVARGDKILLCRMPNRDWWFLPGGRVKTNETSLMALERELSEEIGDCFRVVRPVVCAENFFHLDGISFHEICTFYEVDFIDGGVGFRYQSQLDGEVFEWMSRNQACTVDVKPSFIKEHILNPRDHLELIVHRDGEQMEEREASV